MSVHHAEVRGIVPVMISVPERARDRAMTLAQLDALGVQPHVVMTPQRMPRCERTNGEMGRIALQFALSRGADWVLFCEDDVDFSPSLPRRLSALLATGEAVTLYLPGRRFYCRWGRRAMESHPQGPLPEGAGRVVSLAWWYGSQAMLLPRDVARAALSVEQGKGIDELIKAALLRMGRPLMYAMPNLAQHRSPLSVTSRRYRPHRSVTYGREPGYQARGPAALQPALL